MIEISEVAILVFHWLDGLLTYDGMMRGFTEINPFVRAGFDIFGMPLFLFLSRFVLPIYLVYILKRIKKETGKEKYKMRAFVIAWGVFPVTWNILMNIFG